MDKPGPNGGLIQMPGSFHTEILQSKKNPLDILVYLLDMNFKNPVTANSSAKISLILKNNASVLISCKPVENEQFFSCLMPKNQNMNQIKEVKMMATRLGKMASQDAIYYWPLEIKKTFKK